MNLNVLFHCVGLKTTYYFNKLSVSRPTDVLNQWDNLFKQKNIIQ